jgi:hypothetical protein
MMKIYEAGRWGGFEPIISIIEITRRSDKSFWTYYGGRSHQKLIGPEHHDSFDEAKQYLISKYKAKIESKERYLMTLRDELAKVLTLTEEPNNP